MPELKLVPVRPPGPNARKARAFAAEIWLLRAQGHTFESIREALAAVGVHVSNSTVQREVARARSRRSGAPAVAGRPIDEPARDAPAAAPVRTAPTEDASASADGLSGKQVAEAFVKSRSTNPLIRAKEQR